MSRPILLVFGVVLLVFQSAEDHLLSDAWQLEKYVFPNTTKTFMIATSALVIYFLARKKTVIRHALRSRIILLSLALSLAQGLQTYKVQETSRWRSLGIWTLFPTTLFTFSLLDITERKRLGAIDLLIVACLLFFFNVWRARGNLVLLYQTTAKIREILNVILGIVLATICLLVERLLSDSATPDSLSTDEFTESVGLVTRDSSQEGQIDTVPEDLQRTRHSSIVSLRRLVIILAIPQLLLSLAIAIVTEIIPQGLPNLAILSLLSCAKVVPMLAFLDFLLSARTPNMIPILAILAIWGLLQATIQEFMSYSQVVILGLVISLLSKRFKEAGINFKSMAAICLTIILFGQGTLLIRQRNTVHPLAQLISQSKNGLSTFMSHELSINSLSEASAEYESRYKRLPPPGFDIWFNFVQAQNTLVVSNFDQIERDLAPFRNIEPAELRRRTYTAVQDKQNYLSPLRIRGGRVTAPPMDIPTHYWMLERLMDMMQDFVQYLPDMDIAINLNDEPRVLAQTESCKNKDISRHGGNFTLTHEHWDDEIPFKEETPESFFKAARKMHNTFDYTTRFCPTRSSAKARHYYADSMDDSKLQSSFIPDWQESLDICWQPQLRDSRGYFISPSAYDATNELLPVFSQSKPSTFSDILLPSPWNFGDKVGPDTVDPHSWQEKFDRLFWRGSTTEGWAVTNSWKAMLRQNVVDLFAGSNDHSQFLNGRTATYILCGNDSTGYRPDSYVNQQLYDWLDPDVFLINIDRSEDREKRKQEDYFHLQAPSQFSDHWRHRFLIDMDGAAFSGRFLPFLQSNSLPLKFSSIFTEWWSDRVFAYQHFVPVTLDSAFSVWAYFAGIKTRDGQVIVQEHQEIAEQIGLQGKIWAEKVLRKEDMKIYLWRLLLEYGRLVDDARDSIGYQHNNVT